MKIGDKVKVNKDIPSINGMLREGTMVRIDHISSKSNNNLRIKCIINYYCLLKS